MSIRALLREPFVHFAVIGALLFGIDAYLSDDAAVADKDEIVVSAGRIDQLAAAFAKTWSRPPTESELRALVDDYVLDEALFREGVAMGIDEDDPVIRRRVRSKIEFIIDDLADLEAVSDEVLAAWLAENTGSYRLPARFTFAQVFLNPAPLGETALEVAEERLAQLHQAGDGVDPRSFGDATMLPLVNADYRFDLVANTYGKTFAEQLAEVPVGEWSGPLESAYGLHLVHLQAMTPGRTPELAEVREAVERDWRSAQRQAAVSRYYDQALKRYDVSIEWSEFAESSPGTAPDAQGVSDLAVSAGQPAEAAE